MTLLMNKNDDRLSSDLAPFPCLLEPRLADHVQLLNIVL